MDCLKGQFVPGVLLNGRYSTVAPLNHGSFGMVFSANDEVNGGSVAIKCMPKPSAGLGLNSGIKVDDQSEELKIHTRIGFHPHIVNLLDSFQTETYSYLVLEHCSMGDLYEAIRQEKGPKETSHVRDFMLQLIDALETLHQKGIYHRDIKPENIFLTDNGDMKLGDFGLATLDAWSHEIAVGSDRYMAPEQFDPQGNGLSPARADIWSVGICLLNILFSRNPFAEPAMSDPLYADYVRDKQSLFDVFPNMSQDTFEVLTHCMAIDPEKRSLSLVRDALDRVISFTTDDESLDEFCTESRDVVTTANREPLRTPSLASPAMDQADTFPWSQALHKTPQKSVRPLSVIPDTDSMSEDMFPETDSCAIEWNSKADAQSVESTVDSGLGVSIGSIVPAQADNKASRTKPMPIAGSLPTFGGRASNALASIFGKKKAFESKSWSDMWEEDEEERVEIERKKSIGHRPFKASQLSQIDSESDGRSTPRPCLAEIQDTSAVNTRPKTSSKLSERTRSRTSVNSKGDGVSQHTGFIFEDHNDQGAAQHNSPPSKRSFMDKWSALGDYRRRATSVTGKDTSSADTGKKRFNPSTWRRTIGRNNNNGNRQGGQKLDHDIWKKKEWNTSSDWRRHEGHDTSPKALEAAQLDGSGDIDFNDSFAVVDDSDVEWVGGWEDLHL